MRVVVGASVLAAVSVFAPAVEGSPDLDASPLDGTEEVVTARSACPPGPTLRYVVLFAPSADAESAAEELERQCGSLTTYYPAIDVAVAQSSDPRFVDRLGRDRAYSAQGDLTRRPRQSNQSNRFTSADGDTIQWNMDAIRAAQARAVTPGSPNVLVGVLDSGVDIGHPELAPAIDANRSVDCASGRPMALDDRAGAGSRHGTHVAGLIAAANDRHGVTGVAPGVRLASIRVVDRAGYVHPENAVCGFVWAAEHGVRVANSSFLVESAQQGCSDAEGSPVPREAVRRAVEYATQRGVLTVAAVGNERIDVAQRSSSDRSNCDAVPVDLDGVLSVSAIGADQDKAGYSSYGLGSVDVTAPGGENAPGRERCVLSTVPGGYGTSCGTSMAAPHVSGVAALAASRHPEASPDQLAELVISGAEPLSCPSDYDLNADSVQDALCFGYASFNGFYGHGMVDALSTVRSASAAAAEAANDDAPPESEAPSSTDPEPDDEWSVFGEGRVSDGRSLADWRDR